MTTETTASTRTPPVPDDITTPYWESAAAGILSIQRCDHCDLFIHAPAALCPQCHRADALEFRAVSGRGTVYSSILVRGSRVPGFGGPEPHVAAMVELVEQPRLFVIANVTDCDPASVTIGDAVEVHFNDVVDGITLPQFRLIADTRTSDD